MGSFLKLRKHGLTIDILPGLAQQTNERKEKVLHAMQSAIEATFAQQHWNIDFRLQ
jgi:hypothetical protein